MLRAFTGPGVVYVFNPCTQEAEAAFLFEARVRPCLKQTKEITLLQHLWQSQLTAACDSRSRGTDALFWTP